MGMTGSFHGSSSLCSLIDVGRLGQMLREWGPLAVSTRPLHFAPGRRHSLQILQSTRVDCPLGVSWPGPSLRITKFPPSQLRRHTRPFITLPCRWKGVGVGRGERKATQTINRSREKGRGFVARQLSCSSTSTSRVGEGCGLQRNHESPDGSREAMRRRWAHGWKRRQTRVMQLSMGVLGFAPAEIERERKKAHMTSRWHGQNSLRCRLQDA